MRLDQIALQLYTVRALAAVDLAATLRAVAAAGYRSVELAGLPDTAPHELARLLTETGLAAIASHESIERLRVDLTAVADRLDVLGSEMRGDVGVRHGNRAEFLTAGSARDGGTGVHAGREQQSAADSRGHLEEGPAVYAVGRHQVPSLPVAGVPAPISAARWIAVRIRR